MNKSKNPHARALGRKGGQAGARSAGGNGGGYRPGAGRKSACGNCGRSDCKSCRRRGLLR